MDNTNIQYTVKKGCLYHLYDRISLKFTGKIKLLKKLRSLFDRPTLFFMC